VSLFFITSLTLLVGYALVSGKNTPTLANDSPAERVTRLGVTQKSCRRQQSSYYVRDKMGDIMNPFFF
jgi:hypothetical protein